MILVIDFSRRFIGLTNCLEISEGKNKGGIYCTEVCQVLFMHTRVIYTQLTSNLPLAAQHRKT